MLLRVLVLLLVLILILLLLVLVLLLILILLLVLVLLLVFEHLGVSQVILGIQVGGVIAKCFLVGFYAFIDFLLKEQAVAQVMQGTCLLNRCFSLVGQLLKGGCRLFKLHLLVARSIQVEIPKWIVRSFLKGFTVFRFGFCEPDRIELGSIFYRLQIITVSLAYKPAFVLGIGQNRQ